jgi:hypothetical protein
MTSINEKTSLFILTPLTTRLCRLVSCWALFFSKYSGDLMPKMRCPHEISSPEEKNKNRARKKVITKNHVPRLKNNFLNREKQTIDPATRPATVIHSTIPSSCTY